MIHEWVQRKSLLVTAAAVLSAMAVNAMAQVPANSGYLLDQRGAVVKDAFNLCWRTGFWSPAMATAECDPDLAPKPPAPPARPAAPPPPAKPVAPPPRKPAAKPPAKPAVAPVAQKITLAADTNFDFDKSVLKPEGRAKLDDLVGKMKGINLEVVIAIGHTDSVGSHAYNNKLSMRRADTVKAYLVSKGIAANRIYTEGKGKRQPIADNKSKAGRAKNRRVEVEVVGTRAK